MLTSSTPEEKGAPLGDMLGSLQSTLMNPVTRLLLRRAVAQCDKDGGRKLEVGLELYTGIRKDACRSCRTTAKLVGSVVKRGAESFGVSESELKTNLVNPYWRKALVSVVTGIANFGVRRPFVPGAPFNVVWNITHRCNLKCKHCYENAGRAAPDELSTQQVSDGLGALSRAGVPTIAFSGGEPTSRPDMIEIVRMAKDLGMFVSMASNGYGLNDPAKVREYKEAGLSFVQISLDGPEPSVHDRFRGVNGAWDKAVTAIENCINEDIIACVSTTVTRHNADEAEEMLRLATTIGVKWIMLYNFIPTGRGKDIIDMDLDPNQRRKLLELAFHTNSTELQVLSTAPQYAPVAKELSACGMGASFVPTHFYNPSYENDKIGQLAEFVGGCGAGRFYMAIEPNGDMYPCVFLPHDPPLYLGNLVRDDFDQIWKKNEVLQVLRNKDLLEGSCGKCENRYICGGCRSRAYAYFGDLKAPDPGCVNNMAYWNELKGQSMAFHVRANEPQAAQVGR